MTEREKEKEKVNFKLDTAEGCLNWLLDQATFTRHNNGCNRMVKEKKSKLTRMVDNWSACPLAAQMAKPERS